MKKKLKNDTVLSSTKNLFSTGIPSPIPRCMAKNISKKKE